MRRLQPLVFMLVLLVAACAPAETPDEPTPTPSPVEPTSMPSPIAPAPTPTPTPTPALDEVAWQECTNDEEGYTVAFPADWSTNTEPIDQIPPCSVFDPDPEQLRSEGMELPADIAVAIFVDQVPMDEVAEDDFTVEETDRREETLDGRDAVRRELRHTGEGMYPEDQRTTQWLVDLDGRTLFAVSHDVGDPDYAEKQRVLDEMIETLQLDG